MASDSFLVSSLTTTSSIRGPVFVLAGILSSPLKLAVVWVLLSWVLLGKFWELLWNGTIQFPVSLFSELFRSGSGFHVELL